MAVHELGSQPVGLRPRCCAARPARAPPEVTLNGAPARCALARGGLQPNGGAQRFARTTSEADIIAIVRSSGMTCARAGTQPAAIAPASASVARSARIVVLVRLTGIDRAQPARRVIAAPPHAIEN